MIPFIYLPVNNKIKLGVTHRVQSWWKRTGRECLECCATENECEDQPKDVQDSGKTSIDVRGEILGIERGL